MINIYNFDGEIIMQAPITKEAQREEELSKSDFISLSFSAACKIILPVGAYIVHTYYIDQTRKVTQRFSLLEPYEPVQNDEMSWKYTPEFQHPKMLLGKIPFYIKTKNSQNETIKQTNWTFVGTPDVIMGKICDFLNNDIQFGKCGWKSVLSGELKNSLSVSFSDNDVLSALSSIANAEGDTCEWHIDYDNEDIYLGKVILDNTSISLEVGKNIGTPSVTESKENYYNSYTVFGGTRNITQTNSLGENVSSSDIRLQLASGKGIVNINGKEIEYTVDDFSTIDLRKDKNKEPLLTKVLNFSDVFPSLNTYVYKVRGRQKYVLDDTTKKKIPLTYNADGSVAAYKIFTVWYMRLAYCTTTEDKTKKLVNKTVDNGVTHYWYDFELTDNLIVNGKTLSCSFEANTNINALSTPLAGRGTNGEHVGFELKYHKDNYSAHDSDDVDSANFNILSGDYEIIYQEDNNLIIPTNEDERLIPRGESLPNLSCNITVLYNIAMSEQYQKDAQEKLLDKAIKEIERLNSDLNNYEFSVYPQVFEANNPRLQIGQKVKYSDGQGYTLDTRILKLTTNLDYDFIQEITVGNQANKGTVTQLKDDVQTIIANSSNGNGSSYSGSQFNSIVSKYGSKYFLSKQYDDIAQGQIRFMKGIKIGDGEKGVDAKGNAKLADAVLSDVVVDRVHDAKSTPSERVVVGAQGFDMYMGEDGKSHLYVDYLTTRVKMFAASAEVRKVSYSGGTTIFSNAGSTIVKVAYIFDASGKKVIAYKCYAAADDGTTRTMNWWHVGMMALCQTFNVKAHRDGKALANRYYWRLVVGVGQEVLADGKLYDYVILSNVKDFYGSDGVPCYGIKMLADGQNNVLSWGGVAVSVVSDNGMSSFASVFDGIEGGTQDDGENDIASRRFYGYEPDEGGGEPDAPAPNDVIVQVGDQVRWKKYGNLIKLTTSTEDNATDNAPAIAMYHGMGAPYVDKKSGNTNPYQWKTLTSLDSPELVKKNAKNFMFFTNDDPEDVVSPISTTYEIIASSDTLVRNPMTQTVTPADITFRTIKRYGSKTETLTTALYLAKYTTQDDVTHEGHFVSALSELEVNLYDIKEITVFAYDSINTVLTSRTIAVLTDGEKGEKGDTGEKGKDTISLVAEPSSLTFGTDDKGKARGQAVVQVRFYVGSSIQNFLNTPVFKTENFEEGYTPTRQGEDIVIIDASKIKAQKIVDTADGTERYVSCTSASVTITDTLNGKQYQVKIPIFVDVESYISRMEMTAKQYKQTFEELKSDLGEENPSILTQYTSTIKQSAREISLKVSQTAVGMKNLLPGSALRRQGEGVILRGGTSISVINKYNGVNSATCFGSSMPGLQWRYEKGISHNIKVEKGKTYTISVMARATANSHIYIEGYYTSGMNTTDRPTGAGTGGSGSLLNQSVDSQWNLYQRTFTVAENSPYEFLHVAIMAQPASDATVYLCQPMLVEGDEYVGWSLSEEDAEYIGGNLLDNTDTLSVGGNLVVANGTLRTDANSYNGFPTRHVDMLNATEANKVVLQWDLESDSVLRQGQDYMLSFWAKGKGVFDILFYKDGNQSIFVEKSNAYGGNTSTDTYGTATVELKNEYSWQQYWVHWRVVGSNLPKYVLIRCNKGTDMYVSQPKLEYGATVTEYRATKTDYIEDKSVAGKLLDAGIDIDSKEITLTADKTNFRTRSGQKVAVFDENGLNADLINAKHVWAKSEDGNSTVGHFGNYEPDYCKVSDNVFAPLFVGSDKAAKAPFYVTSTGAIKATAGYIGDFQIIEGKLVKEDSEGKRYMRLDNFNLSFEDTHDSIFRMTLGNFVSPSPGGSTYSGGFDLERLRNFSTSSTSSTSTQYNVGLTLSVSGTMNKDAREYQGNVISNIPNGNHALLISRGDIAGFRPMLTKAKTSRAISKMECVIVCCPPQNANIILKLPDDPEIGQHYTFIQRNGRYTGVSWGKVILKSTTSGKPISAYGAANTREIGLDWQFQITEVWFDGDFWLLQWHAQV